MLRWLLCYIIAVYLRQPLIIVITLYAVYTFFILRAILRCCLWHYEPLFHCWSDISSATELFTGAAAISMSLRYDMPLRHTMPTYFHAIITTPLSRLIAPPPSFCLHYTHIHITLRRLADILFRYIDITPGCHMRWRADVMLTFHTIRVITTPSFRYWYAIYAIFITFD